ncbi:unnamed protein product [Prorocentrum cordatum]|uniref:Aldehyde dehydrogenase domain-containing protein n=1 Tax=Prorocentrum cordatum TaxID=2364126 RepID=A0ABN9QB43_9DINO|nr:unnamed protein product [Polarella glacialis]
MWRSQVRVVLLALCHRWTRGAGRSSRSTRCTGRRTLDVRSIVASADAAYRHWRRVSPAERVEKVAALAGMLRARAEEAAVLINREMGKPVPQAKAEVMKCAYLVDWYAEHGAKFLQDTECPPLPGFKRSYVTYQPLGVILSVMPWNFPFWQVVRMAVPTLMAGNSVVLKLAPNCFGSSLMLEELFGAVPGLPAGLFRALLIDGEATGKVLDEDAIRGVAFTGSTAVGRIVAAKAGSLLKKAVIELGGSDGYAVLADADLDAAARAVVTGRMLNTGQVCIAPKRVLVEKSVKAEFEKKVLDELATKKYGVDFGPMVHATARNQVADLVTATQAAGARLMAGGVDTAAPEGDCGSAFLAPTVLTDVRPGMPAFEEEIFGPVIAITEAEDDGDAVRLANQSEFGLGAAVFTRDVAEGERIAAQDMEAGMCFVNDFVRSDPSLPFGGVKNSGIGRECSVFGMMEFTNVKTICVK